MRVLEKEKYPVLALSWCFWQNDFHGSRANLVPGSV